MTIDECGEPKYRQSGDMRRGSAIVELIQPVEGEIKVEPVTQRNSGLIKGQVLRAGTLRDIKPTPILVTPYYTPIKEHPEENTLSPDKQEKLEQEKLDIEEIKLTVP